MKLALRATVAVFIASAAIGKAAFTLSKANTVYQSKKLKELKAKEAELQGAYK